MNWRDFFYFSKGERRSLTLLLSLITVAWILVMWSEYRVASSQPVAKGKESDISRREATVVVGPDTLPQPVYSLEQRVKSHSPVHPRRVRQAVETSNRLPRREKFPKGTRVELNSADTTLLQKVPGIGPTFARRIVKYRALLGGFYAVSQLAEVYGIDAERYEALAPWFVVDTSRIQSLPVNRLDAYQLRRHPYLNAKQAKAIYQLRKQKSRLSGWDNLQLLEEFTTADQARLLPYLSFE